MLRSDAKLGASPTAGMSTGCFDASAMTPQVPKKAPGWSQVTPLQVAHGSPHRLRRSSLPRPGFAMPE